MEGTSISEIHRYPLRPEGFEEPLFATFTSRRVIAEHLLRAPWLVRASELAKDGRGGQAAHVRRELVEIEADASAGGGSALVVRVSGRKRYRERRRIVEVLDRWREVGGWWDEERAEDRSVFRVLLSDGAVMDLARERGNPDGGRWLLVGLVD